QQPKKKQNTLQTVEPESSMSTNNNNVETLLMNVDPLSLDKGKSKEVYKKNSQDIFIKKTKFFAFFPTDDYPEKFSQTKVSDITNLVFNRFDSFSGIILAKHPEDQSKSILKATFSDKDERNAFCNVILPNAHFCP
ncbi:13062_t:CDS:2, partial [Funneliformis mosseae]